MKKGEEKEKENVIEKACVREKKRDLKGRTGEKELEFGKSRETDR